MANAFFIDVSRCTACRGCQVACKEWHGLPAVQTRQQGTHQNPPDLNPFNYKVVRFNEHLHGNDREHIVWNFFPDQCRHCEEPPCKYIADDYLEGAIVKDPVTGAVIYTELTRTLSQEAFEEIRDSCPYNIPRRNPETGAIVKCDMCNDRVRNGLVPMCVATCPTGTMNFGSRQGMIKLAHERLAIVKKAFPKAQLVDEELVNVIYLITDAPEFYADNVFADAKQIPDPMTRKEFLARLVQPIRAAKLKV